MHGHPYRVAGVAAVGTGLLGASLSTPPGSTAFYGLTAATAATWTVGGLAATPRGLPARREPILTPVLTGFAAFGVFYGCALVVRRIPFLRRAIAGVFRYTERAPTPPVLLTALANGAAEEVFFRGAVYAAAGRHPVPVSSLIYVLTTSATRNPALILAAVVMGPLFGMQRRLTGGIRAPILTHLTWSTLMIHYLPPLFATEP
ncbi:CPBP family intramembrane metalloprotease [Nocardia sp. NEAU-351]|uniref:CPBP family intramembrane metalloprotease n=2 Tax=Nocardia bovistercoris TaxID=2785916 RepID=A0A931IKF6_9NOCA|nr:CPBP family intramembrane metalloprotease [Nocardia bovistercoris]